MKLLRIGLVVVAVAAASGLWWTARGPSAAVPSETTEEDAGSLRLPVVGLEVSALDGYRVATRYSGRIVARRRSELGFDRGGRLLSVEVDEGDRVEAGQRLASLDARELRARRRELDAQVAASRARVKEMEARLSLAERTTERRRELLARESISAQRFDESRFEQEALAAQLAAARADIAATRSARTSVDVALDLSNLVAPYAGSITARSADEGTVVSPGQHLLTLVEDGVLEVRVGLPPEVAAGLSAGTVHELEVAGAMHPARLHALLETVETDTRTVTAVFRFEDGPAGVRDGELARVAIETEHPGRGFWLPISALTESRRGLWSAFALEGDRPGNLRVSRRTLEVIHAEADRVFVRGTLTDGEWVVASGLHRLVPGQRVRRIEGEPEPGRARSEAKETEARAAGMTP